MHDIMTRSWAPIKQSTIPWLIQPGKGAGVAVELSVHIEPVLCEKVIFWLKHVKWIPCEWY